MKKEREMSRLVSSPVDSRVVNVISWPNRERFALYSCWRERRRGGGEGGGGREEMANENKLLQQFAPPLYSRR